MSNYTYVRKTFQFQGKRYYVAGIDEADAERKKQEKINKLESGTIDNKMTVRKWSEIWLETYVNPRGLTPKSYRMYTSAMDNVILPAIGGKQLKYISDIDLQRILNTRAGKSKSDTNKIRIVIKSMFRQALISRLIPFDPSAGLQLPKVSKGSHRSITDAERSALLTFAKTSLVDGKPNRAGMWVQMILYCGLRPGETASLKWDDVDLESETITVCSAKESGSNTMKGPKTKAGIRRIPIPKEYLPTLKAMKYVKGGYVFTQRDGKSHITESSMKRMWETTKKYMDILLGAEVEHIKPKGKRKHSLIITRHVLAEDLDLYDLRHTFCTDLEKKGVPINIAKYLMGHADISTTANIYTHPTDTSLETARKLINSAP